MELIENLRKSFLEDESEFKESQILLQIDKANKMNKLLAEEKDGLEKDYEDLNNKIESLRVETSELLKKQESIHIPPESEFQKGDFFHRMNACDFYEALLNGKLEGQKLIEKSIKDQIQLQASYSEKLKKRINLYQETLPFGIVDSDSCFAKPKNEYQIVIEINRIKEQIAKVEKQMSSIIEECENMRKKADLSTKQYRSDDTSQQATLEEKYQQICLDVKKKNEELKQMELEYRIEESRQSNPRRRASFGSPKDKLNTEQRWVDRKIDSLKTIEANQDISIPETWKNDRESLIQNIQRVKAEIRSIKKIMKANTDNINTRESTTQKPSKNEMTNEVLRQAIQQELDSLNLDQHPVLESIQIETKRSKELDNELLQVVKTMNEIEKFEKSLFDNKMTIDHNDKDQRLAMLRTELEELKEKLSK